MLPAAVPGSEARPGSWLWGNEKCYVDHSTPTHVEIKFHMTSSPTVSIQQYRGRQTWPQPHDNMVVKTVRGVIS